MYLSHIPATLFTDCLTIFMQKVNGPNLKQEERAEIELVRIKCKLNFISV